MIKFLRNKKKDIFSILFFILMFILATKLMPHLTISFSSLTSVTAKADILLGSVISLSLLRGRKCASIYGVIFGFIFDVFIGNPYAFSPLVYLLCAYFASPMASPFAKRTPLSALLVTGMLVWIKSLFSFFYLIAVSSDAGIGQILLISILPEYIMNVLMSAVVFTVMRILMAIFRIPVSESGK